MRNYEQMKLVQVHIIQEKQTNTNTNRYNRDNRDSNLETNNTAMSANNAENPIFSARSGKAQRRVLPLFCRNKNAAHTKNSFIWERI